ncbi:hypothetical protein NOVOSPHI9U_50277 [Novosphingobium sp. 9U]|nr:hypothetical protein NOVOSPHI9U_50277 [Novosphingobium sp. 9U]
MSALVNRSDLLRFHLVQGDRGFNGAERAKSLRTRTFCCRRTKKRFPARGGEPLSMKELERHALRALRVAGSLYAPVQAINCRNATFRHEMGTCGPFWINPLKAWVEQCSPSHTIEPERALRVSG